MPDFRCGLGAVAANQLMEFQFAVGSEEAGASARRTAADDVFLDQYYAQVLTQELRRRADAAEPPPPTISTSHLIAFVRGGQYLWPLIIRVVIHQF